MTVNPTAAPDGGDTTFLQNDSDIESPDDIDDMAQDMKKMTMLMILKYASAVSSVDLFLSTFPQINSKLMFVFQ